MPLDEGAGVWKSGTDRRTPKRRQVDYVAVQEVRVLSGNRPRRRDLLIEFLHPTQDRHDHLPAAHIAGLADEMRLTIRRASVTVMARADRAIAEKISRIAAE